MGLIERYWEDITVYSVGFISEADPIVKRTFHKVLVFPSAITKEEVFYLVPVYFQGIEKILYVEELDDGLLLKSDK